MRAVFLVLAIVDLVSIIVAQMIKPKLREAMNRIPVSKISSFNWRFNSELIQINELKYYLTCKVSSNHK